MSAHNKTFLEISSRATNGKKIFEKPLSRLEAARVGREEWGVMKMF